MQVIFELIVRYGKVNKVKYGAKDGRKVDASRVDQGTFYLTDSLRTVLVLQLYKCYFAVSKCIIVCNFI